MASVWDLPVIFIVENNGYGLSTPSNEQFRCKQFVDKAIGYGMEGVQVDGNNVLEVFHAVQSIHERMKQDSRPVLLECLTFRMRGHEEASGTKYVPQELFDEWGKKDPLENFEKYLVSEKVLNAELISSIRDSIKLEIEAGLEVAFAETEPNPDTNLEMADMFAPFKFSNVQPSVHKSIEMRFLDAITDAMRESMRRHPNLVIMGQDVAEYGGVFKATFRFIVTVKHRS